MPRLASVEIPVYSRSPSTATSSSNKSKGSAKSLPARRTYGDEPLSVKPSTASPVGARIVGRVLGDNGCFYSLKIVDVEINEVGVNEILEYVSADHLEDFENGQFVEEAELLRIAEANEERAEAEKLERRKERAKLKGVAGYYDQDGRREVESGDADVAVGKHGRARPTYGHLFKKVKERRRRKRDPVTGELMPLSDDEEDEIEALRSSGGESPAPVSAGPRTQQTQLEVEKRRRRKRDPVTGELMPLDAEPTRNVGEGKKRRRRKRHPQTGELMPFGWTYEPNGPSARPPSTTRRKETGNMSPAMNRLSISHEPQTKRLKLDRQSSSGASAAGKVIIPSSARAASSQDDSSSDEELGVLEKDAPLASPPKKLPSASRGQLGMSAMLQSKAISSVPDSSPEPEPQQTTSAMQPPAGPAAQEEESDDGEEGEFTIESILAHRLSDPKTHPQELGNNPVMLYQVKWTGFQNPTWEPIDSFPDRSVIDDYERRISASAVSRMDKTNASKVLVASTPPPQRTPKTNRLMQPASASEMPEQPREMNDGNEESDDGDSEDGTYAVEAITGHHFSDPRTHAPEFGSKPVMLYKVKWQGWAGHTWEPVDSFEDRDVVDRYRARVGLFGEDASAG